MVPGVAPITVNHDEIFHASRTLAACNALSQSILKHVGEAAGEQVLYAVAFSKEKGIGILGR